MTNILLLVLDSVRARNLSCYDYPLETTPFLSKFAQNSTVYNQARAPGPDSITSHASMFTGFSVPEHGLTSFEQELKPNSTVWEELQAEGYSTGVFTGNPFFSDEEVGFNYGFETIETGKDASLPFSGGIDPRNYDNSDESKKLKEFFQAALRSRRPFRSIANGAIKRLHTQGIASKYMEQVFNRSADIFVDSFLKWQKDQSKPWAACINFMDAHDPYLPSPTHNKWGHQELFKLQNRISEMIWDFLGRKRPWWQRTALEPLYDGAIRQIDAELSRLIGTLRARGAFDDTLIVIAGDHGEAFGERSEIRSGARLSQHSIGSNEALLHVPLLVKYPGQEASSRISKPASLDRFKSTVSQVLDSTWSEESFVPDRPVIAVGPGIERDPVTEEKTKDYCGETAWRYKGDIRAVYEKEGDDVIKHMTWKDRAVTVRIENAHITYSENSEDAATRVDDVFSHLTSKNVSRKKEGRRTNDETLSRLKHLGYR